VLLIGSLDQFTLSNVLQRIEAYAKTGLLIVKQEEKWVELSFRQGLLMCIGPVRSNKTLGDRLLQAGVISQGALQEVISILGTSQESETRTAITLVDLGYVNQESLYNWAAKEASRVLQVLLTWSTGEIYFEEGMQPPADRLLIALSVTSLLPQHLAASVPQSIGVGASSTVLPSTAPFSPPQRVTRPLAPRCIDTSFMQPQMVLTPADLSALREMNPKILLTPEQWRIFTCADGQTTLQMACQLLVMPREQVCQVAGELIELGLVTISIPAIGLTNEPAPSLQDTMNAGLNNSYVPMPGYSAFPVPFLGAALPANNGSNYSSPVPIETQSQWGNGGNGATFVVGGGWVVASSPPQPVQSSSLDNFGDRVYADTGGVR
jgi:hypothetical protein